MKRVKGGREREWKSLTERGKGAGDAESERERATVGKKVREM